jgi:hypothetical protein
MERTGTRSKRQVKERKSRVKKTSNVKRVEERSGEAKIHKETRSREK